MLASQVPLPLEPYTHPFYAFRYFSDKVSSFCLGPVSDQEPSTYGLSRRWDYRCVPPCPGLLIEISSF
jgi:hypothetical protein